MYSIISYENGKRQELGSTKSLSAASYLALRASRVNSDLEYAIEGDEFERHTMPVFRDGNQVQGVTA